MKMENLTVENIFMKVLGDVYFGKEFFNKLIFLEDERKILFSLYGIINQQYILNGDNFKNIKLSSKQFFRIIQFLNRNKNIIVNFFNMDNEKVENVLKNKITNIEIYESLNSFNYADVIFENIIGFYSTNNKKLSLIIYDDLPCSYYDNEIKMWICKITNKNLNQVKKFLEKHKFVLSDELTNTLNLYSSICEKKGFCYEKISDEYLKLYTINLSNSILNVLKAMEIRND